MGFEPTTLSLANRELAAPPCVSSHLLVTEHVPVASHGVSRSPLLLLSKSTADSNHPFRKPYPKGPGYGAPLLGLVRPDDITLDDRCLWEYGEKLPWVWPMSD